MAKGELVRIRFNTDHYKDATIPRWRALIGEDIAEAVEYPCSGYTINVQVFDMTDTVPNVGEKFHFACRGIPKWHGIQLVVDPS